MQVESTAPATAPELEPRKGPKPSTSPWFAKVPCIKLGGEEWPIPLLAPRQNRYIEPRLMPLLTVLFPQFNAFLKFIATKQTPPEGLGTLTEDQYDEALTIIAVALTRAHPTFQKDDLLDMPGVGLPDVIGALTVIWKQTGLYVRTGEKGAGEQPKPGESQGPSTGTASSPGPAGTSEAPPITGRTTSPASG